MKAVAQLFKIMYHTTLETLFLLLVSLPPSFYREVLVRNGWKRPTTFLEIYPRGVSVVRSWPLASLFLGGGTLSRRLAGGL